MGLRYKCVIILSFLHLAGVLAGCAGLPPVRIQLGGLQGADNPQPPPRPEMQVVAFDPQAAAVARETLQSAGTSADAAVALGFMLAVTSPASAGLGGGGVCVRRDANGALEGIDFRGARLARGLLALHARRGVRPWSSLVVSAETAARFGHPVSPTLAADIAAYGGAFIADATALAAFMTEDRRLIAAGDVWRQPRLADSLARLRSPRDLIGAPAAWFAPTQQPGAVSLSPGTTGFAVADGAGDAVACALTMGRPFGLGSMTRDGGYLFPAGTPDDAGLDRIALAFLSCIRPARQADRDPAPCPAPSATFSLMP